MNPGDQVLFGGKKFTLLERQFVNSSAPMWMVVETDNEYACPRLLIESDLKGPCPICDSLTCNQGCLH